jgi:two-component system CheB/CheR fusion protein
VRSNQVLNQANSDLSNILASIDIPVIMLDADLAVHRFTPSAAAVFELSKDITGRPVGEIGLPLIIPNLKKLLLGVIKAGTSRELEVQDNRGRWYTLLLRPYRTEKGRTEGAVLALLDIHNRKLSEKAMMRLATLVRDSNDAVIIRDLKDRIIAWNKGAQKMYGYTAEEALGLNVGRLMPENARIGTKDLLRLSARGKTEAPIATKRLTKDGRVLDVLFTVTLLCDEKGAPAEIAITERDITAQKKAEEEMSRLHDSVVSAQETERRRIARGLHDGVGQILSGVKFRLEALSANSPACRAESEKILAVSASLNKAIAEIRRVSENLMPSELENLGLAPALRTLCREFDVEGVSLKLRTGRLPDKIAPDLALALFRITQEALNNILKHSRATRISVSLLKRNGFFVLNISDNGKGLALGSKNQPSGRGLGLLTMRERAQSVGGTFELLSAREAGTYITVRVPAALPAREKK